MTREWDDRADVVIVGGGGAGMAAGVAAAQADPDAGIVLLQKLPHLGGATTISMGSISAAGTYLQDEGRIEDSPAAHFRDLDKFVASHAAGTGEYYAIDFAGDLETKDDLALRSLLVESGGETVDWLHDLGCEYVGPFAEAGHSVPRVHQIVPDTEAYATVLGDALDRLGVEIHFETAATELLKADGRIQGLRTIRDDGTEATIAASRGVVLATGDYIADLELRAEYTADAEAPPIIDCNTGDGHRMAAAVGARLVNMDIQEKYLRVGAPLYTNPEFPALVREGAILVNEDGHRFVDESSDYDQVFAATLDQPQHHAYILFDDAVASTFTEWPNFVSTYGKEGKMWAFIGEYLETDYLARAETPAALAESVGMPPEDLDGTISRFRDGVLRGGHRVDAFGRAEHRSTIATPPYYALGPLTPYSVITDGGVDVDTDLHVLDEDGAPIEGLYAAGVAAGGLLLFGHGHHHSWTFTSGRVAGHSAVTS